MLKEKVDLSFIAKITGYSESEINKLKRYSKPEDGDVLKEIEKVLKERPSYGYKR